MPRYAAFLRGVSPMNCKMAELQAALEAAGFGDVKTVLASGNAVFTGSGSGRALEKKCEAAMQAHMGKAFMTIVRPVKELQALLDGDPFARRRLPAGAKRIVTFLRQRPDAVPKLPIEQDGARIVELLGHELLSFYVPSTKGPVFMSLIERNFGKDITTRTWDTVRKVCAAA